MKKFFLTIFLSSLCIFFLIFLFFNNQTQWQYVEEIKKELGQAQFANITQSKSDLPAVSDCSLKDFSFSPYKGKVIFNEIAWMGTTNSSFDEWIELKNISEQKINISNWQILNNNQKIKINLSPKNQEILKLKIPAQGFFVLERTDDDSAPEIPADYIFKGAIKNSNEALYLFDSQCFLVDKVEAKPNWPAGTNKEKRTMERSASDLTWHTSSVINGTPGR